MFNITANNRVAIGPISAPTATFHVHHAFAAVGDVFKITQGSNINQSSSNILRFVVADNGNVGIGASTPTSKLHIRLNDPTTPAIIVEKSDGSKILQLESDGLLRARIVRVDLDSWADFVFSAEYCLMPLNELQNYISLNKHLPNVPSESDVKENGVDLGEMDIILLQKIEELTLYILQLESRIAEIEKSKN